MPKTHKVKKGENLSSIAEAYGHGANWQALYNDPANAAFRKKRPNPMLIQVGDEIVIPPAPRASATLVTGGKKTLTQGAGEDLIKKARALHAEYIRLRDKYTNWVANPERTGWASVAQWTQAFLEGGQGKYDGRVNKAALKKFQDDYQKEAKPQVEAYESKCLELTSLLNLKSFKQQFKKLPDAKQPDCYVQLTDGLNECEAGRTYIVQQLMGLEKKDTETLLTGVFKIMKDANGAFWTWLAEFGPMIVRYKQEKALAFIEQIIIERVTTLTVDRLRKRINLYSQETVVVSRQAFWVDVLTPEHVRITEDPKWGRAELLIGRAFETINFALAIYAVSKKLEPKEAIATLGAIAAMTAAFRTVLNAALAARVGKELITRSGAAALSVITSVCDVVTNSMDAWERYEKGDYNAAAVYGIGTVGAGAAAVGGVMMLGGLGTAYTGVGLIVAIVGGVVVLVSSILAFFADDTPIETWLSNSRFGEDGNAPARKFTDWKNNHGKQLEALKDAIAPVEFSGSFSVGNHSVTLKPNLLMSCSRAHLSITVAWPDKPSGGKTKTGNALNNRLITDKDKVFKLTVEDQRITEVTVGIRQPPGRGNNDVQYSEMNVTLVVDAYNDGRTLTYKRAVKLEPSMTEKVWAWF